MQTLVYDIKLISRKKQFCFFQFVVSTLIFGTVKVKLLYEKKLVFISLGCSIFPHYANDLKCQQCRSVTLKRRAIVLNLRLYLSKILTYNSHFNSRLNSHFLLSRSGNSFLKNSHFSKTNSHVYLIESGNLSGNLSGN